MHDIHNTHVDIPVVKDTTETRKGKYVSPYDPKKVMILNLLIYIKQRPSMHTCVAVAVPARDSLLPGEKKQTNAQVATWIPNSTITM